MPDPDLTLLLAASTAAVQGDPKEAKTRFRAAAEAAEGPCPSCGKVVRHRGGLAWCEDNEMSEKTLQNRVRERARHRGWKVAHVGVGVAGYDQSGNPIFLTAMAAGWPDATLAKAGHHLLFFEYKRQQGKVSPEQVEYLQLLNATGNFAVIIRPSDLRKNVNAILNAGAPLDG